MAQDYAKEFYRSKAWQKCRSFVFNRDCGLCQDCEKKGLMVPAEEVHHIIPITPENITDPSITLNPDNLVSLCRECHKARHGAHELQRYKVLPNGEVVLR